VRVKRLFLGVVLALAACQGSSDHAAPPPPAPTPTKPAPDAGSPLPEGTAQLCHRALDVIKTAPCQDAGFAAARVSIENTLRMLGHGVGTDAKTYDLVCARVLAALEQDAKARSCTLAIDPELRAQLKATLDAYFAIRAAVTPTGDAAADAKIRQLGALRDEACACADQPCLEKLNAKVGDLGLEKAPQAAKDLAGKILDDMLRCQERLKLQ
jgi:hypothetical protein